MERHQLYILIVLISVCIGDIRCRKQRRIKTAKCKYTFVVNELDTENCPNAMHKVQADTEPEKSYAVNRFLPLIKPPTVVADSGEMRTWLSSMEKQLYSELKKSDEINTTLSKHDSSINSHGKMLTEFESNLTTVFRMLRYLENTLQEQHRMNENLDNKLSGVMLDVVEVNNVLTKKVVVQPGQVRGKDIPVQSVSKQTSCSRPTKTMIFTDCEDVRKRHNESGVYYVTPTYASCPIPVWCDMETPPGGWLLLLRRESDKLDFNRLWDDYKDGFGNVLGNFYLGNDNIFLLTNQRTYEMRVDLWDFEGNRVYALYTTFKIDGERDNYRLNVHGYEGSAKDGLKKHDRAMFSTLDRDNDGYQGYNCAREWMAGWWFANCWYGLLTGPYYNQSKIRYRGISWNDWKHEQLMRTEMKIRPSRLQPADPEIQHTSGSRDYNAARNPKKN